MDRLLKTAQVQERLAIGRTNLFELIRKRAIIAVHEGRSLRIPETAIEAYIEQLIEEAVGNNE
jgi:excisionase family DNA binding protein